MWIGWDPTIAIFVIGLPTDALESTSTDSDLTEHFLILIFYEVVHPSLHWLSEVAARNLCCIHCPINWSLRIFPHRTLPHRKWNFLCNIHPEHYRSHRSWYIRSYKIWVGGGEPTLNGSYEIEHLHWSNLLAYTRVVAWDASISGGLRASF